MNNRWHLSIVLPAVACWLAVVAPVQAEVSFKVVDDECTSALVTLTVIEDADPVGSSVWAPLGGSVDVVINPSGEPRGDLLPDLVFDPEACVVQLAWPYRTGSGEFDVVYQRYVGGVPGALEFLTSGLESDRDPSLWVDGDGVPHLVWWTEGTPDAVHVSKRESAGVWESPVRVTGPAEAGRRPSIALDPAGTRLVAYETDAVYGTAIVVSTAGSAGDWAVETVTSDVTAEFPAPTLHVEGGRVWVAWRQSSATVAYSVRGPSGWSAPREVAVETSNWVGVESARRTVRRLVLQP